MLAKKRLMTASLGRLAAPLLAAALLASTAIFGGCGGGVGTGGTGVGSYTVGSVTGFGSVIVNDVRYDDSTASVLDSDDGNRSNSELRLGMTVEVEGDTISTDTSGSRSAKATRIRFGSELVGPVASVDTAAGRFSVLGQTVVVAADTVFDDRLAGGLAGLSAGAVVEVYAQIDTADGLYRATRIEPRSEATAWRLRGMVAVLDNSARTLRIGNANLAWGTASNVPADLAVGKLVRLQLSTRVDSSARWVVQSFGTALRAPPDLPEAELKGLVTSFSSTLDFSVNGLPVDAALARFQDGTAGLRQGARVEVKGRVEGGTLLADSVSIETEAKRDEQRFEFKGPISTADAAAQTITVRGQVISTARGDLRIDNGTRSDLVKDRQVEVKAVLGANRTALEATRIVLR